MSFRNLAFGETFHSEYSMPETCECVEWAWYRWDRCRARARMKLNESHENKRQIVTDSFQLLFFVYQPYFLFQRLLNIINIGVRWSIVSPERMHEIAHIPGTGNGSRADHKQINYAIQTRKLSQYIAKSVGKIKSNQFFRE